MEDRSPDRRDMDELLDRLLRFAQQQLRNVGGFYPFGAHMTSDGQVCLDAAHTGEEQPDPREVIDLLAGGLRPQAWTGGIRATAICYAIDLKDPVSGRTEDAIAVSLEHRDAEPVLVVQPYSKGRLTGWKFGELVVMPPPEPRIFGVPTPTAIPNLGVAILDPAAH